MSLLLKCHLVTKFSSKSPRVQLPHSTSLLKEKWKQFLGNCGSSLRLAGAVPLNQVSASLVHSDRVSNGSMCNTNHGICSLLNANLNANPVLSMVTLS